MRAFVHHIDQILNYDVTIFCKTPPPISSGQDLLCLCLSLQRKYSVWQRTMIVTEATFAPSLTDKKRYCYLEFWKKLSVFLETKPRTTLWSSYNHRAVWSLLTDSWRTTLILICLVSLSFSHSQINGTEKSRQSSTYCDDSDLSFLVEDPLLQLKGELVHFSWSNKRIRLSLTGLGHIQCGIGMIISCLTVALWHCEVTLRFSQSHQSDWG